MLGVSSLRNRPAPVLGLRSMFAMKGWQAVALRKFLVLRAESWFLADDIRHYDWPEYILRICRPGQSDTTTYRVAKKECHVQQAFLSIPVFCSELF
jgi:hypothetical protein